MYLNYLHPKNVFRAPTKFIFGLSFRSMEYMQLPLIFFYFKTNRRPCIPQEMRKIPLSTLLVPDLRNGRKKNHTTATSRTRKRRRKRRPPFTVPFAPLFLKSPPNPNCWRRRRRTEAKEERGSLLLQVAGGGGGGSCCADS